MESISSDIVAFIGTFLRGPERRLCLETAKCFQPINHLNHSHYFEFLGGADKLRNLQNTIEYVKKIKPICKFMVFVFWNIISLDELQIASLQHALFMANMEKYDLHVHKCSCQVRSILLKCFEPYSIRTLSVIFNVNDNILSTHIDELNMFKPETLELHLNNKQFDLLNDPRLMSNVTNIRIILQSNFTHFISSINLEHLTNASLKEVVVDVAQTRVNIQCVERITHLIMRNLLNEDLNVDITFLRCFQKDNLHLQTVTLIDELAGNNNNYSVMNNYWYLAMRVLPKTCTFQYITPSCNGYVIPMLQKMMELSSSIEYLYNCDKTYLISKVVKKLIPNIQCRAFISDKYKKKYSPPEEIENISGFKDIYEHLDDTTKLFWFWLAH